MGTKKFRHFSIEERCEIARRRDAGQSLRKIASALDRSPSSVARELERNSGSSGYKPSYAGEQAHARRWKGSRLLRKPELQAQVLELLKRGLSPEAVAGRLKLERGQTVVSHETIYRFIHAQIAKTKNYTWRHYLPRGKAKRGYRGRKGGSAARTIQGRVPIAERPVHFSDRANAGHWEADSMQFAGYRFVLALHERSSRLIWLQRQPTKEAASVVRNIEAALVKLPKNLRQSITFDNGTEFAYHHRLHKLSMRTFFCDAHAPWQKGGIENAIGRMRRGLPRKTDLATLSDHRLLSVVRSYNHTPRKCLNFYTPAEVLTRDLLHFKCESTFPPARE